MSLEFLILKIPNYSLKVFMVTDSRLWSLVLEANILSLGKILLLLIHNNFFNCILSHSTLGLNGVLDIIQIICVVLNKTQNNTVHLVVDSSMSLVVLNITDKEVEFKSYMCMYKTEARSLSIILYKYQFKVALI
jgi:hypothetical protein